MTEKQRQTIYASDEWKAAQDEVHHYMHLSDRVSAGPEREGYLAKKAEAIAKRDALLV